MYKMLNSVVVLAIFLLVGIAHHEIHGASTNLRNTNGFIHLGSYRQKSGLGTKAANFDEYDYYLSQRPLTWSAARSNCKFTFEDDSFDLISLESQEETEFINKLLFSWDYVGLLWTSGTYDTGSRNWRWAPTNTLVATTGWAPWRGGAPPTSPNSQLRVAMAFRGENDSVWQAQSNSIAQLYICEVRQTAC